MPDIELSDGEIHVEATVLAKAFDVEPALVPALMRQAEITSVCERGIAEDAGRHRLIFYYKQQRVRLLVNEKGELIEGAP